RLQLRVRFREDLPILLLHSDTGVMEVARTSMIHAAAPHFLWSFAARYAAHQLNIWPRVSLPETSPTQRWTGKVGDASVLRDWGSRAYVCDTSADKLSARAIPCVFLGFSPNGRAPSGVSQEDPLPGTVPVEVDGDSGAARGAEPGGGESEGAGSRGAEPGGADPGGVEPAGVEPEGAEPKGVEPGGADSEGVESGGAEPQGAASSGGPAGASLSLSPWPETLSPQQLLTAGASGTGGSAATGPGGARTRGTGAAGTGGVGGAGARNPTEPRAAGAGGAGAGGTCAGGAGARGAGARGSGAVDPRAGGA
ncbi:unnamed protein product, partial [Closterium sp. NIES-54]